MDSTDWRDRAVDWNSWTKAEQDAFALPDDGLLLVYNMPNEAYHAGPGYSSSQVALLLKSAYAFKKRGKIPATDAMDFGTLTHCATLEPGELNESRFLLLPKDENGKDIRRDKRTEVYKEFLDKLGSRMGVKSADMLKAKEIALDVRAIPVFKAYMDDTSSDKIAEVSIYFRCQRTGLQLRIRPDILVVPHDADVELSCFDLKTVKSAKEADIQRNGEKYANYPFSSSFYVYGLRCFFGRPSSWIVIAAETTPEREILMYAYEMAGCVTPYATIGRAQVLRCLDTLQKCLETDTWPRQHEGIKAIEPSSFYLSQENPDV